MKLTLSDTARVRRRAAQENVFSFLRYDLSEKLTRTEMILSSKRSLRVRQMRRK